MSKYVQSISCCDLCGEEGDYLETCSHCGNLYCGDCEGENYGCCYECNGE